MPKLSPDHHLSGSTLAAYMGHSPFQDAYDIILRARESLQGKPRPELDSLQVDMGDATEDITLRRGCQLVGLDPEEISTYSQAPGIEEAKKHPTMPLYYSDDGLHHISDENPMTFRTDEAAGIYVMTRSGTLDASGKVILEAKFTTAAQRSDDPPLYRGPIQVQAGMMCHQASTGIVFTNYGGRRLTAHIYPSHFETQSAIKSAVNNFERHMKADTWPEPRSPEEAAKIFPQAVEQEPTAQLPEDVFQHVLEYKAAESAIKLAEAKKAESSTVIMAALGNYEAGAVTEGSTTYQVKWPTRNYKAKPAECCSSCGHEIKPATEAKSVRQKSISIKEMKND